MSEDDVLAGRGSAEALCERYARALASPSVPPGDWRTLRSWASVRWFWGGSEESEPGCPGPWAKLEEYDIAAEATPDEKRVWGKYGSSTFEPSRSFLSSMASNNILEALPEAEFERFRGLSKELLRGTRKMLAALEGAGLGLDEVYGDPEEIAAGSLSGEIVRERRTALGDWLQGLLRTVIVCRYATPASERVPNRVFARCLAAGWLPISLVGGFASGVPVVFNPLKRS